MLSDTTHHLKERRISKLASEVLAIKAASGLVNLMANKPMSGAIRDSTVAQISAALFYKTNVMAKLASNPQFQSAFRNVIFDQLEVDFGGYIDAKSRTSPKPTAPRTEATRWMYCGTCTGRWPPAKPWRSWGRRAQEKAP